MKKGNRSILMHNFVNLLQQLWTQEIFPLNFYDLFSPTVLRPVMSRKYKSSIRVCNPSACKCGGFKKWSGRRVAGDTFRSAYSPWERWGGAAASDGDTPDGEGTEWQSAGCVPSGKEIDWWDTTDGLWYRPMMNQRESVDWGWGAFKNTRFLIYDVLGIRPVMAKSLHMSQLQWTQSWSIKQKEDGQSHQIPRGSLARD